MWVSDATMSALVAAAHALPSDPLRYRIGSAALAFLLWRLTQPDRYEEAKTRYIRRGGLWNHIRDKKTKGLAFSPPSQRVDAILNERQGIPGLLAEAARVLLPTEVQEELLPIIKQYAIRDQRGNRRRNLADAFDASLIHYGADSTGDAWLAKLSQPVPNEEYTREKHTSHMPPLARAETRVWSWDAIRVALLAKQVGVTTGQLVRLLILSHPLFRKEGAPPHDFLAAAAPAADQVAQLLKDPVSERTRAAIKAANGNPDHITPTNPSVQVVVFGSTVAPAAPAPAAVAAPAVVAPT